MRPRFARIMTAGAAEAAALRERHFRHRPSLAGSRRQLDKNYFPANLFSPASEAHIPMIQTSVSPAFTPPARR
jgi:hypothetical protein